MGNHGEFGLFSELFSQPEPSHDPLQGTPAGLVPGYLLLTHLGKGGMGSVFRARQISLDRVVAIKLLNPELSADPEYVSRFLVEARTAGKLRHLNIVSALDCGSVKETRFMVMEFIEGKTLDAVLEERSILNERVALEIIKQVAEGLEYAWRHGIIHRDIKPQNIMMTPEGTTKICDLGLCKSVKRDLNLTATGNVNCTPTHASPEQARGDKSLDCGTDIYSLGITFYQLVTGKLPFEGASSADYFIKHATAPRVPPHERNPQVSPAVSKLILRMIDPDRTKRPGTPGEVVQEIRKILSAPRESRPAVSKEPIQQAAQPAREVFRPTIKPPPTSWEIRVTKNEEYAVVSLTGRLDEMFDREITRKLARLVEKGVARIVVDLTALDYMNSRGVSAFVAILDDVRANGGDLKLAGARPQSKLVLERLGITLIIQHLSTVDAAIEAFRTTPSFDPPPSLDPGPIIDIPLSESASSPEGPIASQPPLAAPRLPTAHEPKLEESDREGANIRRQATPPGPVPRPISMPTSMPRSRLVPILAVLTAALASLSITLGVLLFRARIGVHQSDLESPQNPRTPGGIESPTPASRLQPESAALAQEMNDLRAFEISTPDPASVLARCDDLRPRVRATPYEKELESIAARAKASLESARLDRFLSEIRNKISQDPTFARKSEALAMIDAAVPLDLRVMEVRRQYLESLNLAAGNALQKATKSQMDGAPLSEQLALYIEAARLSEGGPSHTGVTAEVEALKDRAQLLIPAELTQLKTQLGRLVPNDVPGAYRLAKEAQARYPMTEWTEPVGIEVESLWKLCWQNYLDVVGEASKASRRNDWERVKTLRKALSRWDIPSFLLAFDKAVPGLGRAFFGIEADLERKVPLGMALSRVVPGTPAERDGMRESDVILALNGQKVSTFEEFRALILKCAPGERVTVRFLRGKLELELESELGTAPR